METTVGHFIRLLGTHSNTPKAGEMRIINLIWVDENALREERNGEKQFYLSSCP